MDQLTDEEKARLREAYRPWLCYDSQAAYYAVAASTATDNPTNRLVRGRRILAARSGVPKLTLETLAGPVRDERSAQLVTPRDNAPPELVSAHMHLGPSPSESGDRLQLGPEMLADALRMQAEPWYRDRVYGRVEARRTTIHVQYWLWFYSAATKDRSMQPRYLYPWADQSTVGAWRLIQVDLDAERRPTRVVLQGSTIEVSEWRVVRRIGTHPRLFVAPLTQALFFEPKLERRGRDGWDGSDGRGRQVCPELEGFTGFESWPGRWGVGERAAPSPGHWKAWSRPDELVPTSMAAWFRRRVDWRPWYVRAADEPQPSELTLSGRLEQRQVVLSYEIAGRRPAALLVTVHRTDDPEAVGRRVFGVGEAAGQVQVPAIGGLERCDVRVSAINPYGRRRRYLIAGLVANAPDELEEAILRTVVAEQIADADTERFRARYGVAPTLLEATIRNRRTDIWKAVANDLQTFRDVRTAQVERDRLAATNARHSRHRLISTVVLVIGLVTVAVSAAADFSTWVTWIGGFLVYLGGLGAVAAQAMIAGNRRAEQDILRVLHAAPPEAEHEPPLSGARRAFERALREKAVAPVMRELINDRTRHLYDLELDFAARGLSELRVPESEIRTDALEALEGLLERMHGGSIGIAGLRGVGKSTLINAHCQPTTAGDRRLTAHLSAPVRYDARDFILTLYAQLCDAVLGGDRGRSADDTRAVLGVPVKWFFGVALATALGLVWFALESSDEAVRSVAVVFAVIVSAVAVARLLDLRWRRFALSVSLLTIAAPLLLAGYRLDEGDTLRPWLIGFGAVFAFLGVLHAATARTRPVPPAFATAEERLRAHAEEARDEIRFQQSWSHGYAGKLALPLGAEVSSQKQRSYERRQTTFPELVDELRAFLALAAEAREGVTIGIDEMDKMESGETAERFLNEIKAIFGVERCLYLVSISENAMSSFERRGLPFRDVFDSSFDEVVGLAPLPLGDAKRLLRGRVLGLGPAFLDLAHCLSGGLPRDLLRVTRRLSLYDGDVRTIGAVCEETVREELERKVDAALVAARVIGLEPDMSRLQIWIECLRRVAPEGRALRIASGTMPDGWPAEPAGDGDDLRRRDELEQLRLDLAAFTYYLATVLDFFTAKVPSASAHFMAAERGEDTGTSALDELARARVAFAINPRLAASIVTTFRTGRGWEAHDLQWRSEPAQVAS